MVDFRTLPKTQVHITLLALKLYLHSLSTTNLTTQSWGWKWSMATQVYFKLHNSFLKNIWPALGSMWARLDSQSFTSRYTQGRSHWESLLCHMHPKDGIRTVISKKGKKDFVQFHAWHCIEYLLIILYSFPRTTQTSFRAQQASCSMGTRILFQTEVAWAWGWPLTSIYSRGYKWAEFTPYTPTHVPSHHVQGQLCLSTQSQCKAHFCCSPVRWHLRSHWAMVNKAPCHGVW